MHGLHPVQFRDSVVGQFFRDQSFRDHTDYLAAGSERTVCQRSHQADVAPAVDYRDAFGGKQAAERLCGLSI